MRMATFVLRHGNGRTTTIEVNPMKATVRCDRKVTVYKSKLPFGLTPTPYIEESVKIYTGDEWVDFTGYYTVKEIDRILGEALAGSVIDEEWRLAVKKFMDLFPTETPCDVTPTALIGFGIGLQHRLEKAEATEVCSNENCTQMP